MARHGHTQMPTSYLSHLCQDKTHEAGMELRQLGQQNVGNARGRNVQFYMTRKFEEKKSVRSSKNSNLPCFCATWFIISCVEYTFGVEITYTSLCTIHPVPLPAIHPSCYLWNKKKVNYFDRYVKLCCRDYSVWKAAVGNN